MPTPEYTFLQNVLEGEPRAAYYSFQDQFGQRPGQRPGQRAGGAGSSPTQQRYFENQFSDVYNEYLGQLGSQVRGGQLPTTRFTSFLENFPFGERFGALPPSLRGGGGAARFAPQTQYFF